MALRCVKGGPNRPQNNVRMTPSIEVDVAIVGGGLGGLSLAVALQHRNIECRVFEGRPGLEETRGNFTGILTNGLTALNGIKPGLSSLVGDAGAHAPHISFTASSPDPKKSTSRVIRFNPGDLITVRWAGIQRVLAQQLSPGTIYHSHRFHSYSLLETQESEEKYYVKASFKRNEEEEEEELAVKCKLLVGADGLWSSVRKQMIGDSPRYLHLMNWMAIFRDPDLNYFPGLERGEIKFRSHCDAETRCVIASDGGYTMWIVRKRDESGELARIALSQANGKAIMGCSGSKLRALEQIQGITNWKDLEEAINRTDEGIISERMSMDRLPIDSWSDLGGHVILLGDAAHAQYIGNGLGARTAFEDSHQLGELLQCFCLAKLTKDGIQNAIKRFEEVRIPRLRKIQEYTTYETRVPKIQPQWTKSLNAQEAQILAQEFKTWVDSYPKNMIGDPNSIYFR